MKILQMLIESENSSKDILDILGEGFKEKENLLNNAPVGNSASGGGYGPWKKIGKNSWKNIKTNSLSHSNNLASQIGGFKDFKITK